MRPDFIFCGSCFLEFKLSDLTYFIDHKKSDCSKNLSTPSFVLGDSLQCYHCSKDFQNPWSLLIHIQAEHGLRIVRDTSAYRSRQFDEAPAGLETPFIYMDGIDENLHETSIHTQHKAQLYNVLSNECDLCQSNGLPLPIIEESFPKIDDNPPSNLLDTFCDDETCNSKNGENCIEANQLCICQLSCDQVAQKSTDIPSKLSTLEESLSQIHRIACNKLDMLLSNYGCVTSAKWQRSCSKKTLSSSLALSLSCSNSSGLNCLCTYCECSTINLNVKMVSISCQTDPIAENTSPINNLDRPDQVYKSFVSTDVSNHSKTSIYLDNISSIDEQTYTSHFGYPENRSHNVTSVQNKNAFILPAHSEDINLKHDSQLPTVFHMVTTKLVPFRCSYCGKPYRQKIHLQKHVMAQHTKEKPFYCPHCSYKTVEKSHLTVHIRTHTGEKPFFCRVCQYSSSQNCTLKTHYLRRHPGNRLNCNSCANSFVTELEYNNHVKNCERI